MNTPCPARDPKRHLSESYDGLKISLPPQELHILGLPVEIRLAIYEWTLRPFVIPEGTTKDDYRFPQEWPQNDIRDFTCLALSCKLIYHELVPFFEKKYLPRTRLYFDNVPSLYNAWQTTMYISRLDLLGFSPALKSVQFSLRSTCKMFRSSQSEPHAKTPVPIYYSRENVSSTVALDFPILPRLRQNRDEPVDEEMKLINWAAKHELNKKWLHRYKTVTTGGEGSNFLCTSCGVRLHAFRYHLHPASRHFIPACVRPKIEGLEASNFVSGLRQESESDSDGGNASRMNILVKQSGRMVIYAFRPNPSRISKFQFTTTEIHGLCDSAYTEMTGKLDDIDWKEFLM